MSVHLPIYTYVGVDGFQMYPGTINEPGIHHQLTPGLHLIAGVNGLGKSTFLLLLYHGLVGPSAISKDEFGVPQPMIAFRRDEQRFRRRVADGAKDATCKVHFAIDDCQFEVNRSLHDLSLLSWKLNGIDQELDNNAYRKAIVDSMNIGSFSGVIVILNLIVFMFEDRKLLMWDAQLQRAALGTLFLTPDQTNELANKSKAVAKANSAYRNLNYILNKDRKKLSKERAALAAADGLSAEYNSLQSAIAAHNENYQELLEKKQRYDMERTECLSTYEVAKFNYDDLLREIEALKLARVASAFPKSDESSRYVITRLLGDHECLACGSNGGAFVEKWSSMVADGHCIICGATNDQQKTVVPPVAVDTARLERAQMRLDKARQALDTATEEIQISSEKYDHIQVDIDRLVKDRSDLERRVRQIAHSLPPTPEAIQALETRVREQTDLLEELKREQSKEEDEFSHIFDHFRKSIEEKADIIRERFGKRISEFLVEKAEITLAFERGPVGESGHSYDWPVFQLYMTSGTFDAPAPRRNRSEVSMSQGEFIDLAFRLALVETAADSGPSSMIFDAPEASLDALFMRRAGTFLAKFTQDHPENRLIATSNLTNTDMIPALFGAYEPEEGDPTPYTIPISERRSRVINLLEVAAPTSAVALVGDRYMNLLDDALFPPGEHAEHD